MHIPVLKNEVLEYLNPKPNENFIDCTIGQGGHALEILEKIKPNGKLLGIDRNPEMIRQLQVKSNLILVCDNFANLKEIIKKYNFGEISGILMDLGVSMWNLKESGAGFSFLKDEPLIMRYDLKSQVQNAKFQELTAEEIVNKWSKAKIEKILKEYGQERFAKEISERIAIERKRGYIETTFQLVDVIKSAVPDWYLHKKISFATKTFQALRIAVNQELENLQEVLPAALEILTPGGRMVIISFHSLEDRIVKNFFRQGARLGNLKILTKKPQAPSEKEIKLNPSSRSAKLRVIEKI